MAGNWKRQTIGGKAADVFIPGQPGPYPYAVLFLHGVGQETLNDNPVFTELFDRFRLPCVSPHGKYAWWSDRVSSEFDPTLTAEQYLLREVVPWIGERFQVYPPRIGLLGISMGGQGVLRLAFKHPRIFPVVAGIAPAIDYYGYYGQGLSLDEMYASKEQCRQDGVGLHVRPDLYPTDIYFCIDPADSDWFRGNDRLHEKLNALGIPHQSDLATGAGGHSWNYFNHMAAGAIGFVHDRLLAAGRRLL